MTWLALAVFGDNNLPVVWLPTGVLTCCSAFRRFVWSPPFIWIWSWCCCGWRNSDGNGGLLALFAWLLFGWLWFVLVGCDGDFNDVTKCSKLQVSKKTIESDSMSNDGCMRRGRKRLMIVNLPTQTNCYWVLIHTRVFYSQHASCWRLRLEDHDAASACPSPSEWHVNHQKNPHRLRWSNCLGA